MFNKEYKNDHLWWNVSFSWHHIFILFKNMSFKCPFCPRTFSQRTAYSQHVQVCLRKVEVDEEESNSETHSIDITLQVLQTLQVLYFLHSSLLKFRIINCYMYFP